MSICAKTVFSQNCRDVKNEVFEKKIAFFVFVFSMLETERQKNEKNKMEKGKTTYKNSAFKGGHPKMRKMKKNGLLVANCLTLFVSGREKNAHFRVHYLFWPAKTSFETKTVKTRKNCRNSGFSEIFQNLK